MVSSFFGGGQLRLGRSQFRPLVHQFLGQFGRKIGHLLHFLLLDGQFVPNLPAVAAFSCDRMVRRSRTRSRRPHRRVTAIFHPAGMRGTWPKKTLLRVVHAPPPAPAPRPPGRLVAAFDPGVATAFVVGASSGFFFGILHVSSFFGTAGVVSTSISNSFASSGRTDSSNSTEVGVAIKENGSIRYPTQQSRARAPECSHLAPYPTPPESVDEPTRARNNSKPLYLPS